MESLVTQNVMHASLCHMTSVGASGEGRRAEKTGWGMRKGTRGDRWVGQVGGTVGWDRGDREDRQVGQGRQGRQGERGTGRQVGGTGG